MGYTKIVQYGNVTEVFEYEREIVRKSPSWLQAERLANGGADNRQGKSFCVIKKRKDKVRRDAKAKGTYIRSQASVKRCRTNFFRLCHHNNTLASSIHFLTLTFAYDCTYEQASRHVKRFMERLRNSQEIPLDYISVPELTEKGRFHFHLLVYNLSTRLAGEALSTNSKKNGQITSERKTRNLQRLFERGYVDIVLATYTSRGIAGYMAKYMAKSLADSRYSTTRGFNCSRGIKKITSAGSNSLDTYFDLILPEGDVADVQESVYDVPYLGSCRFTKIVKKSICLH